MEKRFALIGYTAFIMGIISFCFLGFDVYAFAQIKSRVINFAPLGMAEQLAQFVFIGFLVSFLFHIISLAGIFFSFHYDKKITLFRLVTLFAGIASFICLTGDWAAQSDIGKQYQHGLSSSMELTYLYLALPVHAVYICLFIILLLQARRELRSGRRPQAAVKDEVAFNLTQYIGLICGLAGFAFTLLLVFMNIPAHILKYLIPFYCPFIIFPYCFILFYWLIIKRGIKGTERFDEKQWLDLGRGSLLTLRLSIPGMAILCLINYFSPGGGHVLVLFPFYLFMILLLFSGCTLYYNRKM